MMETLFAHVNHWHWWILAVAFVVLEVFVPGTFFLWLGIAAGVVGLLLLVVPGLGWEYQILIFAVLSVVSVFLGRSYLKRRPLTTDLPALNRRGEQYIDRVFVLEAPIINGLGKIRVDDTTWKIEGQDCPAGAKVRVTGVDGTILRVETE